MTENPAQRRLVQSVAAGLGAAAAGVLLLYAASLFHRLHFSLPLAVVTGAGIGAVVFVLIWLAKSSQVPTKTRPGNTDHPTRERVIQGAGVSLVAGGMFGLLLNGFGLHGFNLSPLVSVIGGAVVAVAVFLTRYLRQPPGRAGVGPQRDSSAR